MTDHLTTMTSPRGFDRMPSIPSEYGGDVSATVHMTAENAWRLADQLRALVRNHYQGDATPEWAGRQGESDD